MQPNTPTVLIVEDSPVERKRLELFLESRGMAFTSASDPKSAIEKLSARDYDFIFLDLNFGGAALEGEGVLAWMDRHGKFVPTVVMSEAAGLPSVIRLKHAYRHFVHERIMHGNLDQVSDVLDDFFRRPNVVAVGSIETPLKRNAPSVLLLLVPLLALLVTLTFVATKVSGSIFVSVVVAAILTFGLTAGVWLLASGRLSEKGWLRFTDSIMRKIPTFGRKR